MKNTPSPETGADHSRSASKGFGYPRTPVRVEWRPSGPGAHSRDELRRALDALAECGVGAWWYSAAGKGSYPLFPSKHLPSVPGADAEVFRWLAEEAHARGIALFSWEYLPTAPLLAEAEPDCRVRWMDGRESTSERDRAFVCYNSSYGERFKDYCVEIVSDLGFDGIWFDGTTVHGMGTKNPGEASTKIGCCCRHCAAKYEAATGRPIPEHFDLTDPEFRRYLLWRQDDFMAYWESLTNHVREAKPEALLAFNFFNRLNHGAETGCPIRRIDLDALVASESNGRRRHVLLQHKYLRAISDRYPSEIWDSARDGTWPTGLRPERPDPDPASLLYHARLAAASGGYASFGLATHPAEYRHTLRALVSELAPLRDYIGGEAVADVGLLLSGATKDFAMDRNDYRAWKSVHGTHNMLNALHIPNQVLLDNMLDADRLARFQAIVLPDTRCIGESGAEALRQYVRDGGCLIACGLPGTQDLDGSERAEGILDELLGIRTRHDAEIAAVLEPEGPLLTGNGLPGRYLIAGPGRLVEPRASAEVLARARYCGAGNIPKPKKPGDKASAADGDGETVGAAVLSHSVGQGRAFYLASDIGEGYARHPNRRTREVLRRLLLEQVAPYLHTDAPPNVVVMPWKQSAGLVCHLVQVPDTLLRFGGEAEDPGWTVEWPEDFVPTAPIRVEAPGRWETCHSPTHPETIEVEHADNHTAITLRSLDQHAVLVFGGPSSGHAPGA